MRLRSVRLNAALFLLSVATVPAWATPEKAVWRRETLIGENREHYFSLTIERQQPGSYYAYFETAYLVRATKRDRSVVERHLLFQRSCDRHPDSTAWRCTMDSVGTLDFGPYLGRNAVDLPFLSDEFDDLKIDGNGVFFEIEGARATVMPIGQVRHQIPDLGEDPRIVTVEETATSVNQTPARTYYCRIRSNSMAMDDDWSDDLLLLPEALVEAARRQIAEQLRHRERK